MSQTSLPSPSATARRLAARDREFHRLRILAMAPAGWCYAAIGREEAISRERVRQFVAQAFEAGENETKFVQARAPVARLERALDRLDRYSADAADHVGGRERLLAKLNSMAEIIKRRREIHGDAPPGEDDSPIAEAALDATNITDFVDDPAAPSSAGLDIA